MAFDEIPLASLFLVGIALLYLVFLLFSALKLEIVKLFWYGRFVLDGSPSGWGARLSVLRIVVTSDSGSSLEHLLDRMRTIEPRPGIFDLHHLNTLICADVTLGQYSKALQWRTRWNFLINDSEDELLVRINEAEALACLGRFEDSLAHINREAKTSLNQTGIACHRAWVLSTLGRLNDAEEAFKVAVVGHLPPSFRSEFYFSQALIAMLKPNVVQARTALANAQLMASRASTKRNLYFMNAQLSLLEGDVSGALKFFELGAAMSYRRQGGDALPHWGETLARLGRREEARSAWNRCISDDPESPAAEAARVQLAA